MPIRCGRECFKKHALAVAAFSFPRFSFEGRFWRQGQTKPVLNSYMIAEGLPTEDYFTNMIEEKRQTCGETLDGWEFRTEKGAVRELVNQTLSKRIK